MAKKKNEVTIRSSAAEYLTFVATTGDTGESVEIRYEDENEKGKLSLTDELKGTMTKQIERFNPQEPLFLLIDYFRVRFPTTDALAVIREFERIDRNDIECES